MTKYLVVIEATATGFSAYSPDLLRCVNTGGTREETAQDMREAIEFHIEGLQSAGYPVLQPSSSSVYVEVAA